MFRIIIITALAVLLLLSGTAAVYAQTTASPALARMHQFDKGTFTESVQEMQEVCLTQGGLSGLTEEQKQEHLDTMQQHMQDGTMQQHMQDGTMQQHMTDGTCQQHIEDGTMEEMHQDMNSQTGNGSMQEHMGGSPSGTSGPTGNGSAQGHMGGGSGGRMDMM